MTTLRWTVAAVVAGLAAPGSAVAQWTSPQTVSGPSTFVDGPSLVFSDDGRGLATWTWQDGVGDSARSGARAATREPYAPFAPQRTAPLLASGPATYGSTRAVVLEIRGSSGGRERLSARFGSTTGRFGRGHTLARANFAAGAALAAAGNGEAVAAWIERRGDRRVVLVATRHPGGRFSRAQVIRGSGRADFVSAAVNDGGSIVVAWARHGRVEARVRAQAYGRFGPVQDLGSAATVMENRIATAVTTTRRMYVAWSSRQLSEGGDEGPFVVRAAVRLAGPHRFRAPQVLERGPGAQPQEARLALDLTPGGSATLAWTVAEPVTQPAPDAPRRRFVARVSTTDARARFGLARTISPPGHDAAVGDVAISARDETLVVWSRLDDVQEVGTQVFAAVRPARAAAFGAPEAVSPVTERARVPAAAYDPRTGLPTVVWSARIGPDGPGVPLSRIRTYVRAATRGG
jgi:hypothetical protein